MEDRRGARWALSLLVACEVLAVAGLHRLGSVDGFAFPRRDVGRWLRETPAEDVLLAGVRLAALVVAWWLLATTLLYVGARLSRLHGAVRSVGWVTLPGVRRWADRAAAVSIVAASALGAGRPAAAGPAPPPPTTGPSPPPAVVDLDHRDRSGLPELPPVSVRTGYGLDAPPVPPPPATPPPATVAASHVITPGEHLWSIAAEHLATRGGRARTDLTADDIAPYWRRLVDLNRTRLRSGDVNLVYPGETIELPPP